MPSAFRSRLGATGSGKRFSVFRGDACRRSQRGRGYVAYGRLHCTLLGGSWALLALILPHFFAFVFYIDFSSIFSRFWRGLGGVLGSQKALKIDIWGVLGGMLFETLFSTICPSIFVKIDGEKRQDVWWNFHMSSHDLFVERHVFHKAGNPENIDFP